MLAFATLRQMRMCYSMHSFNGMHEFVHHGDHEKQVDVMNVERQLHGQRLKSCTT